METVDLRHARKAKHEAHKEYHDQILRMRSQCVSYKAISRTLNIPKSYVMAISKENGHGGNVAQHITPDNEIADKLRGIGLEYIGGYAGSHTKVKVRCLICGGVFERRFDNLTARAHEGHALCPICLEKKKKEDTEQRETAKREARINAERQRMEREADLIGRQEEVRLANHVCKNCGTVYCIGVTGYNSSRYCSEKCMKRWAMRVKNDRRLKRIQTRDHDNDITLEKLFVRDNGVCYICGGMCNWASVDQEGNAQEEYPSIDHVVPLSKGGKHKWDNVKLAHRGCNTRKGDRDMPLG